MSGIDAPTASATTVLLALALLTAATAPAIAATDTPVRLVGPDESPAVGETTSVAVVVGNADGGVGAYDMTVDVEDPDVATVVDVALAGDPGLREVEIAPDGSNASVRTALMDTDDRGEVTIATVTLAGESVGSTDIGVSVDTLGDEEGRAYAVTAEEGSSVVVTDESDESDESDEGDDSDPNDRSNDDAADASTDDPDSDDTGSDTENRSPSDSAATETVTAPDNSSTDAESDADAGDGGQVVPVKAGGFGSLSASTAFVAIAGLILIGGAAYLRRLR